MATLLGFVGEVLTWVIASLDTILDAVIAQPLLLLMVALGAAGFLFGWLKGLIHF
jgi:hypothetical protein